MERWSGFKPDAMTHDRLLTSPHRAKKCDDSIGAFRPAQPIDRWHAMQMHLAGKTPPPVEPAARVNGLLHRLFSLQVREGDIAVIWRIVEGRPVMVGRRKRSASSSSGFGG